MRSGSVKALSRGGDPRQRGVELGGGKLHEFRDFGPDQRRANGAVRINFFEHGAVEGELADVAVGAAARQDGRF